MSQENVEVIRRVHEQMGRGNFWALPPLEALLDPRAAPVHLD